MCVRVCVYALCACVSVHVCECGCVNACVVCVRVCIVCVHVCV